MNFGSIILRHALYLLQNMGGWRRGAAVQMCSQGGKNGNSSQGKGLVWKTLDLGCVKLGGERAALGGVRPGSQ